MPRISPADNANHRAYAFKALRSADRFGCTWKVLHEIGSDHPVDAGEVSTIEHFLMEPSNQCLVSLGRHCVTSYPYYLLSGYPSREVRRPRMRPTPSTKSPTTNETAPT